MTHEEMRGVFLGAWHRGADAVYFFNLFTGPYQNWPRDDHDRLIRDAGLYEALRAAPRRHVLSIISPWSTGETRAARLLPYSGKHGVFRLYTGPKPEPDQQVQVELVLPQTQQVEVKVNDMTCPGSFLIQPDHIAASGWTGAQLGARQAFRVPTDVLGDGYNLIEVFATEDATIKWVEISVR